MWSHDFCTVCDKQCPIGSMYCSDSCRLAEMSAVQSPAAGQSCDQVYSSLNYTPTRAYASVIQPSPSEPPALDYFYPSKPATPAPSVAATTTTTTTTSAHETSTAGKSFLYASPLLLPQTSSKPLHMHGAPSPPPSPLLMSLMHDDDDSDFESSTPTSLPVGAAHVHSSHVALPEKPRYIPHIDIDVNQHDDHLKSSTNYRRWLTAV